MSTSKWLALVNKGRNAMLKSQASIVVNRSIEDIFTLVSDPEYISVWMPGIMESKLTSARPIRVGTTFRMTVNFMADYNCEVTEYEPNRRFVFKGSSLAEKIKNEFTFEPIVNGTRIDYADEIDSGFFKLLEPIFKGSNKRHTKDSFAKLKQLLETT